MLPTLLADAAGTGLFAAGGAMFMLFWMAGILLTIFWIWMLVDCLGSSLPTNEKLVWVVLMVFLPVIGSFIYFFTRHSGCNPTHRIA